MQHEAIYQWIISNGRFFDLLGIEYAKRMGGKGGSTEHTSDGVNEYVGDYSKRTVLYVEVQ